MEAVSLQGVFSGAKWFAVVCFLAITGLGCSSSDQSAPSSDPSFEWFMYEGNDPVYEGMDIGEDEFLNPIIAGFYPDPSIARAGDDYYMVHSSFSYYPGIPIFHSKDLVNWTQVGHVMDRPSQLDLDSVGISRGIFAPTIEYNEYTETFYVQSTLVDAGGNFIVTAKDPEGPWSDPVWLPKANGIDPSIFFDDDGKAYFLHNGPPEPEPLYGGHRTIWMWEYDEEAQELVGDKKIIIDGGVDISKEPIWIEAPHMMKIDGTYYLSAAEGGTGPQHSQVIFKSDDPWGPYEPWDQNPILTQRHLDKDREYPIEFTGHADMVETQNGEWWAVFLGVRPYENDAHYFNTGRETFMLPVTWEDGWPTILEDDKTVPYKLKKPDLPEGPESETPTNGNFTLQDDFDEKLADYWTFIRTPKENWHSVENGRLNIRARSHHINGLGQPSFIGRRQQHLHGSASTKMSYKPEALGDEAGLVAYQNENYYYFLGVGMEEENTIVIKLHKQEGDESEVLASAPVEGTEFRLKIEARGSEYDFQYAEGEGEWQTLFEGADGKILSTTTASGFVGTMIGMYGYSSE